VHRAIDGIADLPEAVAVPLAREEGGEQP